MGSWKKTIILSAAFLAILTCILAFLICPIFIDISKNSKELFDLKKEYSLYQDKTSRMNSLKESQTDIDLVGGKINNLFVDAKIPINLIESWEKIAKDTSVLIDISPISLKDPAENPDEKSKYLWSPVGFQIIATGSYGNFMKFLAKLENSPYLSDINSLILKNLEEREVAAENSKKITMSDVRGILTIKVFSKN
jgi:hypothetical protein